MIFISDLLEYGSNRVKENYQKGKKDRFTYNNYHWPYVETNKRVTKVWTMFISSISNQEGILLSPINILIHKSAHMHSISKILEDHKYLKLSTHNRILYFELEYIRGSTRIKGRV